MAQETIADAVKGAYGLLEKPSQQAWPYQTAIQMAGDAAVMRSVDLNLSQNLWAIQKKVFRPNAQDVQLNVSYQSPAFVTSRAFTEGADATVFDEEIIDYRDFNSAIAEGRTAVALYGNRIVFTRDVQDREYTFWYVPTLETPTALTDSLGNPAMFFALIKYDLALEGLSFCERDDKWMERKAAILVKKQTDWESRWHRYINRPRQRGSVKKRAFVPGNRRLTSLHVNAFYRSP